jgi:tetratricopeptide (TPR) repeat protein
MIRPSVLPATLAVLLAATPAPAQQTLEGFRPQLPSFGSEGTAGPSAPERYGACLRLAHEDPDKAVERARSWQDTGGGDPARHCAAMAHLARGDYARAGQLLEDLARTMEKAHGAAPRARALSQASLAWLRADRPARAAAAATQGLELQPDNVELLLDRAHARFFQGAYWKAIDDLNRASEIAPDRAEVYVYRASAYRYVDAPTMARENLERALELEPQNPEALFELGALNRIQGDTDAARQRWLQVLEVAPDAPIARAARRNLQRMDVQAGRSGG